MCQQSIEKSLKAVLCALGLPVPMVYELGVLVGKIPASADLEFGYELASLSEFASFGRYQEGVLILSLEEAQDVVAKTESILLWSEKIVFGQAKQKLRSYLAAGLVFAIALSNSFCEFQLKFTTEVRLRASESILILKARKSL